MFFIVVLDFRFLDSHLLAKVGGNCFVYACMDIPNVVTFDLRLF